MAKKAAKPQERHPESVLLTKHQSQAIISIWRDRQRILENFQQEITRIDESLQELGGVYAGIHQLPVEGGHYRFENSKEEELILRLEWVPEMAAEAAEKVVEPQPTEDVAENPDSASREATDGENEGEDDKAGD